MRKLLVPAAAAAVLFLFFIQAAGTLVESVYILDLMNTSLDARALGVLAFLAGILLLPVGRRLPGWLRWALIGGLVASRGILPYLSTAGRLYAAVAAVTAALLLFPTILATKPKGNGVGAGGDAASSAAVVSAGLAFAVGLSVLLRSVGFGLDYSLVRGGGWAGWILGAGLVLSSAWLPAPREPAPASGARGVTLPVLGVFLVLALAWFAFSAPSVIARWTDGSYPVITAAVSLLSLGWFALAVLKPSALPRLSRAGLVAWNALFAASLVATILAHRVAFPATPDAAAVVAGPPAWPSRVPLAAMLLLFPVLFADLRLFAGRIAEADPSPRALAPGVLLGGLALVVLVFAGVFTNVWGYVDPVSTPFRNRFWLPFAVAAVGVGALAVLKPASRAGSPAGDPGAPGGLRGPAAAAAAVLVAAMFVASVAGAFLAGRPAAAPAPAGSLRVMTYNIQAGNDGEAERAIDRQLAVIRSADPDVVALQESDTARIGLNNNDYVRYLAARLGMHAWYGPATVTGTFGTAILSRYPLRNTRVVFSFSDTDEIGTAEAEIEVGGRTLTVVNVHPDGSAAAKGAFARDLAGRVAGKTGLIALGDFNLRETDAPYALVAALLTEAWEAVYPARVGPDGWDGKGRIDHVFVSRDLGVRNPVYLQPPASATDHPVHWAEVTW